MTIKEGVESAKVTGPGKPINGKTFVGGKPDDQINKPNTVANSPREVASTTPETHLRKSSKGSGKVDKSPASSDEGNKHVPHYLRPSSSSCHHFCKYGIKPEKSPSQGSVVCNKSQNHAKYSNKTPPAVPKSAVPTTPKGSKSISGAHSPVGSSSTPIVSSSVPVGNASKVSPKEKPTVDKSESQVKVVRATPLNSRNLPSSLPSKPFPEKKTKASVASHTTVSRTPKPPIDGNGNTKMTTTPPNHALNGHGNAKRATPLLNNVHGNAKKSTLPSNHTPNGHSNAKTVPRISDNKTILKTKENPLRKSEKRAAVKSYLRRSASPSASSNPQQEKPDRDGIVELSSDKEELGINDQICANEGEDVHQFDEHSHIADEVVNEGEVVHQFDEQYHNVDEAREEERVNSVMELIENEEDGCSVEEYCNECNDKNAAPTCKPYESINCDKCADEKNGDFEPYEERNDEFEPYGESLADEYVDEDFDSEYSEEYSEYSESPESECHDEQEQSDAVRKEHQTTNCLESSKSLEKRRFRRGQIIGGTEESQHSEKRRFRRGRIVDSSNPKPEPENVNLRHQELQARKAAEEWMLNHVIEKAVNKLAPTRKSKVKTLVGAFETVISGKESETNEPKHVGTKDVSQNAPEVQC